MAENSKSKLENVVNTAIDTALKEVHTCLPAVVTKVDSANQLIDVQPTIKRKLGGELVNLPLMPNVPIRYFKSATFSLTFPIEVDDHVLIFCSERSIDVWLTEGGIKNPADIRKFSLSDAFALPMMYPQTDKIPSFNTTDLEIKTNSGDTKIIVKASEDVEVVTTGEIKGQCATAVVNATTSYTVTSPISTFNGDVQINGKLDVTGIISSLVSVLAPLLSAATSLLVAAKEMSGHTHSQPNDNNGDVEAETNGPT